MKIAIPAKADNLDDPVDERLGRCRFFCVVDRESENMVFRENGMRDHAGSAGLQVPVLLAKLGVNKLYAVEVGPKAKDILQKLEIRTQIIKPGQTVRQVLETIKNHDL